uniref:U1-type domain-containing protein n=2 Tax=Aegilops tauschii subsp. strangulata TaxID=200361 RepID=A0A453D3U4_AEGTS
MMRSLQVWITLSVGNLTRRSTWSELDRESGMRRMKPGEARVCTPCKVINSIKSVALLLLSCKTELFPLQTSDRGPPVQRQPLKHRDYEVDLESRLGKTQVVTPIAPLSQQAGYYCSVCECVVKDSANYLDHINGKKHQRALGMSMRVERASLEQVQKRFEALKKRKDPASFSEQDLDERIW